MLVYLHIELTIQYIDFQSHITLAIIISLECIINQSQLVINNSVRGDQ